MPTSLSGLRSTTRASARPTRATSPARLGVNARGASQVPVRSASARNDRSIREGASLRNFRTLRRQLAGSSAMRLFANAATTGGRMPAVERRAAQSSQITFWTPFGLAIDNERNRA